MPFINLIQEQRLAARRTEGQARTALFGLIGTVVVTAGGFLTLMIERDGANAQAIRLKTEIQKLSPILKQVEANNKEAESLKPRLDTLLEAQAASDRWARILTHLVTQTPKGTWLTGMRSTSTDLEKPIAITLTGTSNAQSPIGDFILRVQNEPDLENVNLHFTQDKQMAAGKAYDFEIAADIAGTETKKVKEKKEAEA